MHDGMQYDPIQGQGQGHEPIFKGYLLLGAGKIFILIYQKTVEKKNNTKTIKSERRANNLTKQVKICNHFPIQFIIYSSINQLTTDS